jgi:hypothetical protein
MVSKIRHARTNKAKGLSTNEPNGNEDKVADRILHLARRLLDTLPKGDDR